MTLYDFLTICGTNDYVGIYNMDTAEASECAALVKAKHSIPYHMTAADSGVFFDRAVAEQFEADGRIILEEGEELELVK